MNSAASVVRGATIAAALVGLAWSVTIFPVAVKTSRLEFIAADMLASRTFEPDRLARIVAYARSFDPARGCLGNAPTERAVVTYYAAGDAVANKSGASPAPAIAEAKAANEAALRCSVYQPQLWLQLFWLATVDGTPPDARALELLRLSYRFGPNEGWVSSYRSRVALRNYDELSPDLQETARREFVLLVRDNPRRAATTIRRQERDARAEMASWLTVLPLETRAKFKFYLAEDDIAIPGVAENTGEPPGVPRK